MSTLLVDHIFSLNFVFQSFFLRSHILAGEPSLRPKSDYQSWSWLTRQEVEERLMSQGDEAVWEGVKGMFGVADESDV